MIAGDFTCKNIILRVASISSSSFIEVRVCVRVTVTVTVWRDHLMCRINGSNSVRATVIIRGRARSGVRVGGRVRVRIMAG